MEQLNNFIKEFKVSAKADFTHLSMDGEFKGKYYIQAEHYDEFMKLYCNVPRNTLSIVEYTPKRNAGNMRFDLDLSLPLTQTQRYGEEKIKIICKKISKELAKFTDEWFDIHVLRRPHMVIKEGQLGYKDGLHIIIPNLYVSDYFNKFIRDKLVNSNFLNSRFIEMKVIQCPEDIWDESIYNKNGFMMYGSDKQANNPNGYKHQYTFVEETQELITAPETSYSHSVNTLSNFNSRSRKFNKFNKKGQIQFDKITKEHEDMERTQIQAKHDKQLVITEPKIKRNFNFNLVQDYTNCLKVERADNYHQWFKIGCALKSEGEGAKQIFHDFSKRSQKYEESLCDELWDKLEEDGAVTIGTIIKFARDDNPDLAEEINKKHAITESKQLPKFNHNDIAKNFVKFYKYKKFIQQDGVLYYFNGIHWESQGKEKYEIINCLAEEYYDELIMINEINHQKNINKENITDEQIEEFKEEKLQVYTFLQKFKNIDFRSKIVKAISNLFDDKEIEFDRELYLFAFKNCIFDLRTQEFVKPKPEQYITQSCGYKYEKVDNLEDKINKLHEILITIMSEESSRIYLFTAFATGMCGKVCSQFNILNGGGRNGKGVLMKLMAKMLGKYFKTIPCSVFTESSNKDSSKANPAKAALHKARFVSCSEPSQFDTLNCATIKEITGEEQLTGSRQLYSSNDTIDLCCSIFIQTNEKPPLSETTQAIMERIRDVLFANTFTSNDEDVDDITYFKQKPYYDTNEFREEYKIVMFHYLLDYFKIAYDCEFKIHTPKSIIDRNLTYLEESNAMLGWFFSLYDEGGDNNYQLRDSEDKKEYVKLNDLYTLIFKRSEYFKNLTAIEKKTMTKKMFIKQLLKIKKVSVNHKERLNIPPNTTVRNVIIHTRLKYPNDVDSEDSS